MSQRLARLICAALVLAAPACGSGTDADRSAPVTSSSDRASSTTAARPVGGSTARSTTHPERTATTATPTTTSPPTTAAPPGIRAVDLANSVLPGDSCWTPTYGSFGWYSELPVPLRNGSGSNGGERHTGAVDQTNGLVEIELLGPASYGDFDHDGKEEAVVVLRCGWGGPSARLVGVFGWDGSQVTVLKEPLRPVYRNGIGDIGSFRVEGDRIIVSEVQARPAGEQGPPIGDSTWWFADGYWQNDQRYPESN